MSVVSGISGTEQITVHAVRCKACTFCNRPNPPLALMDGTFKFFNKCRYCGKKTPKPSYYDALGKPLGTIAYYHRNPFKRWAWKISRFFKEKLSWRTELK